MGGRDRPIPGSSNASPATFSYAADGLPGIWVEADLREGRTDRILIDHSREADLLALGSRAAYGDHGRVSLGETATRVLRDAACPTLVVPAP